MAGHPIERIRKRQRGYWNAENCQMTATTNRTIIAEDIEFILQDLGGPLSQFSGSTILITGAAGFLCSYFVETLAALNDSGLNPPCRVLAVGNLRTSVPERLLHLEGGKMSCFSVMTSRFQSIHSSRWIGLFMAPASHRPCFTAGIRSKPST